MGAVCETVGFADPDANPGVGKREASSMSRLTSSRLLLILQLLLNEA
jgi:hypothetical protein